jgi:hypothetical protein
MGHRIVNVDLVYENFEFVDLILVVERLRGKREWKMLVDGGKGERTRTVTKNVPWWWSEQKKMSIRIRIRMK